MEPSSVNLNESVVPYMLPSLFSSRWAKEQLRYNRSSGAATTINTYDEYGVRGAANAGRFQFTGQMWLPEVGLYHYRARAYSPTLGRFLQADPILYAGGMNLYAYVGNDPLNWVDPLGLQEEVEGVDVTGRRPLGAGMTPGLFGRPSLPHPLLDETAVVFGAVGPDDEEIIFVIGCRSVECRQELQAAFRQGLSSILFLQFVDKFIAPGVPFYDLIRCSLRNNCTWVDVVPFRLARLGCECFEEGTLVATPDGLRQLEEIEAGDLVLAWNEKTGEVGPHTGRLTGAAEARAVSATS
jgi:RHS repeat-associated protein